MNLGNLSPRDLHLFLELSETLLSGAAEAKELEELARAYRKASGN